MKITSKAIGEVVAQAFKDGFEACRQAYAAARGYDPPLADDPNPVLALAATVDDRPRRRPLRDVPRVPGDLEANLDAFRSDILDALRGAVIVGGGDRPSLYDIVVAVRDLAACLRGEHSQALASLRAELRVLHEELPGALGIGQAVGAELVLAAGGVRDRYMVALAERDAARNEADRCASEMQAAIDHACKLVDEKAGFRDQLEAVAMAPDLNTLLRLITPVVDGDRVTKLGQAWFPIATMTSADGSPFTAQDLDLLATACHQICAANGAAGGSWFGLARRCESLAKMLRGAGL